LEVGRVSASGAQARQSSQKSGRHPGNSHESLCSFVVFQAADIPPRLSTRSLDAQLTDLLFYREAFGFQNLPLTPQATLAIMPMSLIRSPKPFVHGRFSRLSGPRLTPNIQSVKRPIMRTPDLAELPAGRRSR
jgi:hypothetical protein